MSTVLTPVVECPLQVATTYFTEKKEKENEGKGMQVVGLTGGIACGKSTLSRIFLSTQEDPPAVIDLDLIARQVVAAGTPAYHQIIHQFGSSLIDAETGEIDRKQLGSIIFGDPEKRRLLNDITHRPIFWSMLKQLVLHFLKGTDLVVLDSPLLYETGLHRLMNKVVVVYASPDVQLKRLMERDNISKQEALLKIESQMPLDKKCAMADMVVDNSGDIEDTKETARVIIKRLQSERGPFFFSRWFFVAIPYH